MTGQPGACDHYQAGAICDASPARPYLPGRRCGDHAPVAPAAAVTAAQEPPAGGQCAECGAGLAGGRERLCQSCAALALIAAEPAADAVYAAAADLSRTGPCASCGTAPVGPGGILCPGCKSAITSANGTGSA